MQTRSSIASSVEKRELSFENVELSRKSVKISSKDSVHRRSIDDVRVMISAAKRKNVNEHCIITSKHNMMIYSFLEIQ
jgi:uncharacterized membrane protein